MSNRFFEFNCNDTKVRISPIFNAAKYSNGYIFAFANRTLSKDLNQKIITYAHNGIPEYWVIDLVNEKLIVHTKVNSSGYALTTEHTMGTVLSLAFPNIAIALDELLLY